jgi:hypothetical protein
MCDSLGNIGQIIGRNYMEQRGFALREHDRGTNVLGA